MLREGLPARVAEREALGEKIVRAGNPRRKCFRFDRLERKDHREGLTTLPLGRQHIVDERAAMQNALLLAPECIERRERVRARCAGRECRGAVAVSAVVGGSTHGPRLTRLFSRRTARRSARYHILRALLGGRLVGVLHDQIRGRRREPRFGEGFMNHPVRVEVDLVIVVVAAEGAHAHERARRGEL